MRKRRKSKANNQTFHFQRRCEERLGIQLNRKEIMKRIQTGLFDDEFYFLNRQSNRVTRYRYKYRDIWYIIPYDKNTHKVITIFKDNKQDIPKIDSINSSKNPIQNFADKIKELLLKLFKNGLSKFGRVCSSNKI